MSDREKHDSDLAMYIGMAEAQADEIQSLRAKNKKLEGENRIKGEWIRTRQCPDHSGKWERGRCLQCEVESLRSEAKRSAKPRIVAAAVLTDDGVIHSMPPPHRHHHIVHAMNKVTSNGDQGAIHRGTQGFLMSDGNFVRRVPAVRIATEAGQVVRRTHPKRLFSEDLW